MLDPLELAQWAGGVWVGPPPTKPLAGLVHDSRKVRPGFGFIALPGQRMDGHAFVDDAFRRGADAVIVARPPSSPAGPTLVVADTRTALTHIARGYRATWTARIIGVTGSVGKTTTKDLVAHVLAIAGTTGRTIENWNNDIGLPLSLVNTRRDCRWGVFEVGMNHPGELRTLCDLLGPHWGILTRVGPVHIEFFADESAIADEKATLLKVLPSHGLAILAPDEPWFERLASQAPCRIVTVALRPDVGATYVLTPGPSGLTFTVEGPDGWRCTATAPIPGEPFLRAAVRAAAVGHQAGLTPEQVTTALHTFQPPPMRGTRTVVRGVTWVNDAYNANLLSMRSALDTWAADPIARKWVVLGGMRELGTFTEQFHRELGAYAARGPWAGILWVGELTRPAMEAALAAGWPRDRTWHFPDAQRVAEFLATALRPGDGILLKGSRAEQIERVLELWNGFGPREDSTRG